MRRGRSDRPLGAVVLGTKRVGSLPFHWKPFLAFAGTLTLKKESTFTTLAVSSVVILLRFLKREIAHTSIHHVDLSYDTALACFSIAKMSE